LKVWGKGQKKEIGGERVERAKTKRGKGKNNY
jgi:hypothetical protein